ncbi:MAG TPA: BamA/TamA family outer membrane protein [Candidatus Saccharimonadales bacterium]|nr:BamA/TamA family outer membrane protein [Candidatus Saccharimonadales bacterium]
MKRIAVFLLLLIGGLSLEAAVKPKSAELSIGGYGPLGGLEMRHTLLLLEKGGKKPAFYDATFIEDGVAILFSRLTEDGYLRPRISVELTLADGKTARYTWNETAAQTLPRPLEAKRVHFQIDKGVLYFYKDVQVKGLQPVSLPNTLSYFMQTGSLIPLKQDKIYSPERLKQSISSVLKVLENKGYRDARAVPKVTVNNKTGEVVLSLQVEEGPQSIIRSVREEIFGAETNHPAKVRLTYPGKPFSTFWEQDYIQGVKTNYYRGGFPDVSVTVSTLKHEAGTNNVQVDLETIVKPGPKMYLGQVEFHGAKKTSRATMEGRVKLEPGELADRIKLEQARYRLSQLGVFDSVTLRLAPVDAQSEDAIFDVKEGKTLEASVLFGFGTYELLRIGLEIDQHNILGLADSSQLRLSQSFKTTSAYYVYSIPDLVAEDVNLFIDAEALKRQEISFLREEYGGGIGAEKYVRPLKTDFSVRYDYELLTASQIYVNPSDGLASAVAGAFIFDIKHDQRDNPLYPHQGYKVFANIEVANQDYGGQVNYERFDIATSYHLPIGAGRWLHLGLEEGAVFTGRGPQHDLPFDRRFFSGGENSIRGYNEGGAASRDANGNLVGAETMTLASLELEQSLTPKLSFVAFLDTLGEARRVENYPFNQILMSVGAGLGWRTLIGPIRLEYGYNLNRRPGDPAGTVQFSVGFPF